MEMNLLNVLLERTLRIVSIASGVVLGTLLIWIISCNMSKRFLPNILKSLSENLEIIKTIQTLHYNSESEKTCGKKT
mgnify:CR=1 FL=1